MVRPVIVAFILLQSLEQRNASGGEQTVGSDDHEDHGDREQLKGLHRIFHRQRHPVARSEADHAGRGCDPFRLRLLLPRLTGSHELHRGGPADLDQVADQNCGENRREQSRGEQRGFRRQISVDGIRRVNDLSEEQKHQPAEEQREEESSRQRPEVDKQRLPEHDHADMLLFHPEDVVQSEFRLSALHDKAVGIQQDQDREDRDDVHAEAQDRCKF